MPTRLAEDVRIAIAAALGQGKPKSHIAREFKVSRPTIDIIAAQGKSVMNQANPLAQDWRTRHTEKYIRACDRIDEIKDAAKAVAAGQTGLTKLGLLGGDNPGQTKIEVWLGSDAVAKIAAKWTQDVIDVKPVTSISDSDNTQP